MRRLADTAFARLGRHVPGNVLRSHVSLLSGRRGRLYRLEDNYSLRGSFGEDGRSQDRDVASRNFYVVEIQTTPGVMCREAQRPSSFTTRSSRRLPDGG